MENSSSAVKMENLAAAAAGTSRVIFEVLVLRDKFGNANLFIELVIFL